MSADSLVSIMHIPENLLKEITNPPISMSSFLISTGMCKSIRFNHWEDCWTMDEYDYAWFLLRWSCNTPRIQILSR